MKLFQLDFDSYVAQSACDYTINKSMWSIARSEPYGDFAAGSSNAKFLLQLGILYWRRGNYDRSEQLLLKAQEISEDYLDVRFSSQCFTALALVNTSLGKTDDAISAYQQAITWAPDKFHLWNNLGSLYLQLGQYGKALDAFKKTIKNEHRDPIAWTGLANTYYHNKDVDEAIRAYERALSLLPKTDPEHPRTGLSTPEVDRFKFHQWLRLAVLYTKKCHYQKAIEAYRKILDLDPENDEVQNEIGILYSKMEAYEASIQAHSKAVELNPRHGEAYLSLAYGYTRLGKHQDSVPFYIKAIKWLPRKRERELASRLLAEARRMTMNGDLTFADEKNNEVRMILTSEDKANLFYCKYNEDFSMIGLPSRVCRGKNLRKSRADKYGKNIYARRVAYNNARKNRTGGRKMLSIFSFAKRMKKRTAPQEKRNIDLKGSEKDSTNPFVWNEKGNIHFRNQDYVNAVNAYNKAIQLDPAFGRPYSNLALIHFIRKEYLQAVQMYQKSITLLAVDREKAIAWNCLGNVYRCMKDYASARTAYQNASYCDTQSGGVFENVTVFEVSKKYKDCDFWNDLGKLFFDAADYEKATHAFREAIALEPSSWNSYSYLARVLTAQGQYRAAISLYRKCIDLISDDKEKASVWNRLGDVYRKINDYDNAFKAYQNAIELTKDKFSLLSRTRLSLLSNCASKY